MDRRARVAAIVSDRQVTPDLAAGDAGPCVAIDADYLADLAEALERGRGTPPVAAGVAARPCRCDPPGALTGDGEPRCSKCGRAAP